MNGPSKSAALILTACLSIGATCAAAAAPPAPTAKPAQAAKTNTLPTAIAALQKEYQTYLKDPAAKGVRVKCDYFKDHPAPDVTPEAIVKALEGSVSGGPGVQAYVKWQLLSAVPGKFPDDLVKRAIAVYHYAPMPGEHPGMDHYYLKRVINGVRKEQVPQIQHEFDEAVARFRSNNEVLLQYRDELFARLPVSRESIDAGLEDVMERAGHGLIANRIFDNVAAAIRNWALVAAKPGQVQSIINTLARIQDALSREENRPYSKIVDDKGFKWKAANAEIEPKKLDELIKFLETNASGPAAGGLKFKDPPK